MTARLFLSPPHMSGTEQALVAEAFASNYIAPAGPMLDAFETAFSEMSGFGHCVALSSGTAAMHLALLGLGLERGEEVWASSLTFIASIGPAAHEGAIPVFVDCDRQTWTMDPVLLEEALAKADRVGRLPRAVIPTDLYGQSCDLDRLMEICSRYGVALISDSAEAVGARYKGRHAGQGASAAIYSFNGNKIITTSSGGMLASDDEALIRHARHLSTQAREPVAHYEHQSVGFNYRLSNVCAAIGVGQLQVLDLRVQRRREIFARYVQRLEHLPGVSFMPEAEYGRSNRWLTVIQIDPAQAGTNRQAVMERLNDHNIESRPVWKPMHLQPVFKDARVIGGAISEALFEQGLCLPSGSAMSDADVDRVSEIVVRAMSA